MHLLYNMMMNKRFSWFQHRILYYEQKKKFIQDCIFYHFIFFSERHRQTGRRARKQVQRGADERRWRLPISEIMPDESAGTGNGDRLNDRTKVQEEAPVLRTIAVIRECRERGWRWSGRSGCHRCGNVWRRAARWDIPEQVKHFQHLITFHQIIWNRWTNATMITESSLFDKFWLNILYCIVLYQANVGNRGPTTVLLVYSGTIETFLTSDNFSSNYMNCWTNQVPTWINH